MATSGIISGAVLSEMKVIGEAVLSAWSVVSAAIISAAMSAGDRSGVRSAVKICRAAGCEAGRVAVESLGRARSPIGVAARRISSSAMNPAVDMRAC